MVPKFYGVSLLFCSNPGAEPVMSTSDLAGSSSSVNKVRLYPIPISFDISQAVNAIVFTCVYEMTELLISIFE